MDVWLGGDASRGVPVAVVEVGHVRVGVRHRLVDMAVGVDRCGHHLGVSVGVVAVVMGVFVVVLEDVVLVLVGVAAAQDEAHFDGGDRRRRVRGR